MKTTGLRAAAALAALMLATMSLAQVKVDTGEAGGRAIRLGRDSAAGRVVSVEYEGRFSNVRIERSEPGAEPNQHPVAVDAASIRSLLASLRLAKTKPEPLLSAAELDEISAPVAAALRKAKPDQDVTFAVSDRHGVMGPLAPREVTTARVFRRDGQLNVIVGLVRRDFENELRGSGYLIPFEPGTRAKAVDPDARIGVENGAGVNRRADWVTLSLEGRPAPTTPIAAPVAPIAPPSAAQAGVGTPAASPATPVPAVPAPHITSPRDAAPAAAPDADAIYRGVSERLKALQKLRDSGLITEQEYQEKRRQILKDM